MPSELPTVQTSPDARVKTVTQSTTGTAAPVAQRVQGEKSITEKGKNGGRPKGHKSRILIPILLLAIGLLVWNYIRNNPPDKAEILPVSGRIEGYETNVGAKIAGRVEMIANREGDVVKVGQLLVRLSDEDIQAQLRGANARWEKSKDAYSSAQDQIKVIDSQIDEAKLNLAQAGEDAEGRIKNAEANVAAAEANLSQSEAQVVEARANLALAKLREGRYNTLAACGAVTTDQSDQATTTRETAEATLVARQAQYDSARKQLSASRGLLTQARTSRLNPGIRAAQLAALEKQLNQARSALKQAGNDIQNAKASVDEISANIVYLNIPSPISGIVTARSVEPGAVVAAGQTVIALINLDTVYLRAYVPELQMGRVRVGQKATVYLDNDAKNGYKGSVIEIDPEASFTPENIYFKNDRVKQVFGIKIAISQPGGFAKPGMPADAEINTEGK
jgi:HlyD family secretion protein